MTTSITKKYKHISGKERYIIATLYHRGFSKSAIARIIHRNRVTITREIARNGGARVYDEDKADACARKRWHTTHQIEYVWSTYEHIISLLHHNSMSMD